MKNKEIDYSEIPRLTAQDFNRGRNVKAKMKKTPITRKFRDYLIESLKDPADAVAYINAAIEENDGKLLASALRDVTEAQGGMVHLSKKTKLNRPNLYKMLSENGNPRIHSLEKVLHNVGLRLSVMPEKNRTLQTA